MLLNSINSLSAEKAYEIGLKKSNINFRSSSTNSLERTPEEDTVENIDDNNVIIQDEEVQILNEEIQDEIVNLEEISDVEEESKL